MIDTAVNSPAESTAKTDSSMPQAHPAAPHPTENGGVDAQPDTRKPFGARSRRRLVEFFSRNPGEELSIEDAAHKLGVSTTTAGHYLSTLAGDGLLVRVSVYRLRAKE